MRLRLACLLALALVTLTPRPASAQEGGADRLFDPRAVLPPALPWDGASTALVAAPGDPWITPAEEAGFRTTPTYAATRAWLERLVAASPHLALVEIGASAQGRPLVLVVASADGAATPEALRANGKPTVFAQAGIHAGEIDGKDAGLMLLRDLTTRGTKADLLDGANFVFLPVLNVDGHARRTLVGRVNQRGPHPTGWRTTARNLNLNRDYAKLDTPEARAVVAALDAWQPALYLDLHVTDGAQHQYDVTYAFNRVGWSPAVAAWMTETLAPALRRALTAQGHVPGPYFFAADGRNPAHGIAEFFASPRYSHGYGDARHLPSLLVETHSLKPYRRRVLGTYVLLEACLRAVARDAEGLRAAVAADRARRPARVPLAVRTPREPAETRPFRAVRATTRYADALGDSVLVWGTDTTTVEVPVYLPREPALVTARPAAYWIPAAWADVTARVEAHGIAVERLTAPRTVAVERIRLTEPSLADAPFEGRLRLSATPVAAPDTVTFQPGAARVPTDQPLGTLAMLLLEAASPDSFLRWGFFHEVLTRTEYIEPYVLAPLAERMLAASDTLRTAFEARLAADPAFAADPRARLRWFYRRTPFYDARFRVYPVARERR